MAANSFVPRAWATRQIKRLELGGDQNKREIVGLSQRFGVLTRYTTLLALESEQMMDEYRVRKTRRDNWKGDAAPEEESEAMTDGNASGPSDKAAEVAPSPPPAPDPVPLPLSDSLMPSSASKDSRMGEMLDEDMSIATSSGAGKSMPTQQESKSASRRADVPMKAMKRKSSNRSKSSNMDDLDGLGLEPAPVPRPIRTKRPAKRHYPTPRASIRAAKPVSAAEAQRVESRRNALSRDPNNRSKRMRLIRTMLRAGDVGGAVRNVEEWLVMNAMDPEALVQKAQIRSYQGRVAEALSLLESAVDTAPRGEWIQQRIQAAYESLGERELACAHRVSLAAIGKGTASINECGIVSDLTLWGVTPVNSSSVQARDDRKLRGDLTVDVTWSGAADIDLLMIEPDGRLLSWLSQRRKLKTAKVRSVGRDTLELKSARDGTFGVRIVRADAGSEPVQVQVKVRARGTTKTFDVVLAEPALDVAEVEFVNTRWSGRFR